MRSKGLIYGFTEKNTQGLEAIIADLFPGTDINSLRFLQKVYSGRSANPTVADLCFDIALMKHSEALKDNISVSSLICDDESITKLFADIVRRFTAQKGKRPPKLSELAEFVFAPAVQENYIYGLSFDSKPELPMPGSSVNCLFSAGGKTLSLSEFAPDNGITGGMYGFLMRPADGMDFEEFMLRIHRLYFNIQLLDPAAKFLPCTDRGILEDILSCCNGGEILCGPLPGDNSYPESALNPVLPGAIIFTRPKNAKFIDSYYKSEGLRCGLVYRCNPDIKEFLISGSEDSVIKSRQQLEKCMISTARTFRAEAPAAGGYSKLPVKSSTQSGIEAFSVDCDCYAAMSEICKGCSYAIAGTLAAEDPGVIPFIIAGDAFIRNTGAKPLKSAFTIGDKTDITLFRINRA